ncbi:MAG: patatin-like phospholipase family protein [Xenococcaceae cyanobacterium]
MALLDRLTAIGPKRILALDGGGIRGAMTSGFLERLEQILRDRYQKPDLRLCDYFDLIGGTSTGAIAAAALAIGLEVSQIQQFYLELGDKIFGHKKWKLWECSFDAKPLQENLKQVLGDRPLSDPSIKTGLCIVVKRADTGSTWPLHNHPKGKYYRYNKDILLREAVRASTAAPTLFVPEKLEYARGQYGAFVDGAVSMASNPALTLFLIATLKGFRFNWCTGADRLLLVSVGTGLWERNDDVDTVVKGKVWDWAQQVPLMLMEDANWQNQLLLQYLSRSQTPWEIDRDMGDLSEDLLTPEPALTYLRYDVRFTPDNIKKMGLPELAPNAEAMEDMTNPAFRYDMLKIGRRAAELQIKPEHLPEAFDLLPSTVQ